MDKNKIAERLRNLRNERNLTTQDVAKATGISTSAVSMYETGERIPRDEIKIRLANFYNVTIDALFFAD